MSEVDARFVKRGFWVNTAQGGIAGSTITTDVETGTILVALLAILSSLAVTNLWGLVLFGSHQSRAHGRPADALYRQQQALLRIGLTPDSFLADWMKLYWIWRKRTRRALQRSYGQLVLALAFSILTVVVGISSSYVITSTDIQVLVQSSSCGPLNIEPTTSNFSGEYLNGLSDYRKAVDDRSVPFSQECFRNSTTPSLRCRAFIQPSIDLKTIREGCPFGSSICQNIDQPAVSIDSGLITANSYFGWNMNARDAITFRRKITCAILEDKGRTFVVNVTNFPYRDRPLIPGEQLYMAYYGSIPSAGAWQNFTFYQSLVKSNVTATFNVGWARAFLGTGYAVLNGIKVLPEMQSNDSDLMLIAIMKNQVAYLGPYQFCLAQESGPDFCTSLDALPSTVSNADFPGASDLQIAAIQLLVSSALPYDSASAADTVFEAGDIAAQSAGRLQPLPDDQWIREIVGWERYFWASVQTVVSDYAIGYGALVPSIQSYVRTNLTAGERQLCSMQRMVKPGGFVNISVFGLSFIIAFSCIVTILNLALLKFLIYLSKFRRPLSPRIERWIQDGVFQLQRQAYGRHDQGSWERIDKEIPATVIDEILYELPLELEPPACSHVRGKLDCTGTEMQAQVQADASPSAPTTTNGKGSVGPGSEDGVSVDTHQTENGTDWGYVVEEGEAAKARHSQQ
ncbi:hypothetical protein K491DRAFT_681917 [Lophiostoma macrostomum CBS 122681]|uniref:Uncharacterized protein n=1 Tax=Lophiostoma macrostomum CBS 122681 TaxID=1314788 RepID=A0A6A6SVQ1_9PLEO|nr:hypothetical protein K491DRAFT_681917 [Lophiostoma macrostomum CBS 122681]